MYDLFLHDGAIARPLGGSTVRIGRGPTCDVMLPDETVSTQHAALWVDGATVYVQDLSSRNGTFVNGERVRGVVRAGDGDELRFGNARASLVRRAGAVEEQSGLALEDLATGLRVPLTRDRLSVGSGPEVELRLPDCPDAVILVLNPNECALGIDDDLLPLRIDTPFTLGDRQLCVRPVVGSGRPTRVLTPMGYPYTLTVGLEGGPGPYARLRDPGQDRVHQIDAENRATLLWLLGRKLNEDLAAKVAGDRAGWCDEAELLVGIWGRGAGASAANLRVLACRLRKEVREAGFEPWFLETKAGYMRLRLAGAELV